MHRSHDGGGRRAARRRGRTSRNPWGERLQPDRPQAGRKLLQLCKQVSRAVSLVLAEMDDSVLQDVAVDSVLPAPNASRLLVQVYLTRPVEGVAPTDIVQRLFAAGPRIRAEIATMIHRRKAPELSFALLAPPQPEPAPPTE
ncbi:MAG TPA: ribosome-binding factor A [Phycisphaerae bacterium]|jgi:ribosome-binding factor A